jgi:hypothetical protein
MNKSPVSENGPEKGGADENRKGVQAEEHLDHGHLDAVAGNGCVRRRKVSRR